MNDQDDEDGSATAWEMAEKSDVESLSDSWDCVYRPPALQSSLLHHPGCLVVQVHTYSTDLTRSVLIQRKTDSVLSVSHAGHPEYDVPCLTRLMGSGQSITVWVDKCRIGPGYD